MTRLYVLGAKQRSRLVKSEAEWNLFESALILEIDTCSGLVRTCVEYQTPPEARASETASSVFKSGTIVGNTLYACTNTEVLVYRVPTFELLNYVSNPWFNDVHHVRPSHDGSLLVASTGLDMVVRLTPDGNIIEQWNVLPESTCVRFSPGIDYRKIATTKPHHSHPNFVFEIGPDVWVTRFKQKDALCLTDTGRRIAIADEYPHDGLLHDGVLYFTVVDGRMVTVDSKTLNVERVVDFKTIDDPNVLLGWCRGVMPQGNERVWVGFTRVRKTRFMENILWVKRVFKEGMIERPTHISLYDTANLRCLQEIDLEVHGMNMIFSIFPAD